MYPCDLTRGQILCILVNASPPKPLDIATSNFAGIMSHDVESSGQYFVTLMPRSNTVLQPSKYQLSKSIVHEIKFGDIAVM